MQQLFIRKSTYTDFRGKSGPRVSALEYTSIDINEVETQEKHYLSIAYIDVYATCMLQLEAHSLLTSCLMNTVLCTTATNLIRLSKRFNCSLVRV
jgi:hypothetical protein